MSFTFPKAARLRIRSDYLRLAQHGERKVGKFLVLEMLVRSPKDRTRLGITASRHYGDSHERNRFKRLVREAFRLALARLPVGYDLNVKPRHYAKKAQLVHIQNELVALASRFQVNS